MKLDEVGPRALGEISGANSSKRLEDLRVKYLGRKGEVNQLLAEIPELPREEDRRKAGVMINQVKQQIEETLAVRDLNLRRKTVEKIKTEPFDRTEPGIDQGRGSIHPLTQLREFTRDTFEGLGFEEVSAPHLDTDDHNFGLLNISPEHPSRDLWDTLYLEDGRLMRTHTSNMQVRAMRERKPPIRVMTFDRCFRYENLDPKHSHTFTQFEVLYVDRNVSMAHLKFMSDLFMKRIFGDQTRTRFRPKYYPFVEPGVGIDALCPFCEGKGCRVCGMVGWLEIAGAGLVHPTVLKNGGIDPEKYSGLAWGFGPDRMLMVKLGIDDIRHLNGGDLRFLNQF